MEYLLKITKSNIVIENKYSFLDTFKEYIDDQSVYNNLNSYKPHQLINIYNFIKTRLFILNELIDINLQELPSLNIIDYNIFNNQLIHIINDNIYIAIFIINSILMYDKIK